MSSANHTLEEERFASLELLIPEMGECDDSWFIEALALYRDSSDAGARLRMLRGCYGIPFQVTRKKWRRECGIGLIDLLQEASLGVVNALRTFQGANAEEFRRHVEETVCRRVDLILENPAEPLDGKL